MPRLEYEFFIPIISVLTVRRTMMGITQEQLNDIIGCADGHLAKWEAGMLRPSIYFLLLWAEALDYRVKLEDISDQKDSASTP